MQLFEAFDIMVLLLEELIYITQGLVVIVFLNWICTVAIARNTQVLSKATHTPIDKEKRFSLRSRIWQRLRPRVKLPEGDEKELTEK